MSQRRKIKRSELHRMVWEQSLSKLAPGLGLSDAGLRKICKRYNIPLPPQGYWARKASRRSAKLTPLPNAGNDVELLFHIPLQATPEGQSELDEKFGSLIAAEALPDRRITVADPQVQTPDTEHAMTRAARKRLEKARVDQDGAVVCSIPGAFRIRVSPQSVERALRITDALARALDARSLAIEKGEEKSTAGVRIAGQLLRLSIEESFSHRADPALEEAKPSTARRGRKPAPVSDLRPTGHMALKIENIPVAGVQTAWRDTSRRRLEDRLNEVIVGLYEAAHAVDVKERKETERLLRIRTENARRAALRAERESEIKFFEALEANAKAWQRAQTLRAFATAVEEQGRAGVGEIPEDKSAWLARARRLADRIDPLTPDPPSPLDYADRDLWPLSDWARFD